jgi:hypothetical protein
LPVRLAALAAYRPRHEGDRIEVKVRDLIRTLERDGWRQVRQQGSHRQFSHPVKPGKGHHRR